MQMDFQSERPLFVQVAEALEEAVFVGAFEEEAQVPSTTEISARYRINPATVLKGMNILVEQGVLYKKRGLGMYVCEGAVEKIRQRRQDAFFERYVLALVEEAKKLRMTKGELIALLERGMDREQD